MRPLRKNRPTYSLDHALGKHCVGHFHKTRNVGAIHIAYGSIGTGAVFQARRVDALHDDEQAVVYFFCCPVHAHSVLAHFQT